MAKRRFSPDFEKRWQGADVVLNAFNANGRKLYAEKKTLGENSDFFKAMFFNGFKETNQQSVGLPCDYDSILKILQFIYDPYMIDWCPPKGFPLMDLYITAEYLTIPGAKKRCLAKIREDNDDPVFNAFCAQERELPNLVMNIMENMTAAEVYKFIVLAKNASSNAVSPLYSKKDIALICRKLIGRELPQPVEKKESKNEIVRLEMVYREIPEPMIDLKMKWPGSDVTIQTKDSKGKLLYTNKGVLTSNSPYFQKLFSSNESGNDKVLAEPMPLDVNYITMKMILEILHNCDASFTFLVHGIHPVLVYEMYSAANEEKLDIPVIREICCRQLKTRSVLSLEVAIKLELPNVKTELLNNHYENVVLDWLCADENNLKYISDGKEVVLSTGMETPVLSIKELFVYFDRIHREAHAKPAMRGDNVVIVDYLPLVPDTYTDRPRRGCHRRSKKFQ